MGELSGSWRKDTMLNENLKSDGLKKNQRTESSNGSYSQTCIHPEVCCRKIQNYISLWPNSNIFCTTERNQRKMENWSNDYIMNKQTKNNKPECSDFDENNFSSLKHK